MRAATLSRRDSSGFTLLEVLVAFSIAAMALGILFQIYAKGTTATILGKEYTQAITIAESRVSALGISEDLEAPEQSGTENDKYHWRIEVRDYEEEEDAAFVPPITLKQVIVEVSWDSRGRRRIIRLNTLKPVPVS